MNFNQPNLPYSEYSWSMNHHMGRITKGELFALLVAAYQFRENKKYAALINKVLVSGGVLTSNIRDGKVDTWRDYQQILPELGLILSTKYFKNQINLTPLGLMYIDGEIGYSELFSTQALNYQYPNGYKSFPSSDISRLDMDTNAGILIKPGLLILQILLELHRQNKSPQTLSTDECLVCLLPTKRNSDWLQAYSLLIEFRKQGNSSKKVIDNRIKRDVQEWFKFLSYTDLFSLSKKTSSISLSSFSLSLEKAGNLQSIIDYHVDESNFWMPINTNDKIQSALSWFEYFGNPRVDSQLLVSDFNLTKEYVNNNYTIEPESTDYFDDSSTTSNIGKEISLRPFSASLPKFKESLDDIDLRNILSGRKKLQSKTRQHQEIVISLAKRLIELDYEVSDDPQSVDLLAAKNTSETIFEVKTINSKNMWGRIRLGVGQLAEYRYRRQSQIGKRPNSILVLSNEVSFPGWMTDYSKSDIQMGLIFYKLDSFMAKTEGLVEKEIQNV